MPINALFHSTWQFKLAGPVDCMQWSHGTIELVADLYSEQIFGFTLNNRCGCGYLTGSDKEGLPCPRCRMLVTSDSAGNRRRRMAKLNLAADCPNPMAAGLSKELLRVGAAEILHFPIAPIAYRIDPRGEPNIIGKKYEKVVRTNEALAQLLPPREDPDYYRSADKSDTTALQQAIADLLGNWRHPFQVPASAEAADTLMGLLAYKLSNFDPEAVYVARCCFIVIEMQAAL